MQDAVQPFDFDALVVPRTLDAFDYVLTQEQVDRYRRSVDDPDAQFPTLGVKHDVQAFAFMFHKGGVNAETTVELLNPPLIGKRIFVSASVVDKYLRREQQYVIVEARAVDEDERPLENITTTLLLSTKRVGQKWSAKGNE